MCLLLLLLASPASAQNYQFSVPELEMNVVVNPDASAKIEYRIEFQNVPGAHPIDVVDIGVPHERYDLRQVRASIDGVPLRDIRPSQYVKPGFEVHLGGGTIPPGRSGTFRAEFVVRDLVFQDTTNRDYASLRITPTWFGQQYVRGATDLKIAVHLPPGVEPDEAKYQAPPFTGKARFNNRTVVYWELRKPLTGPNLVGVSFPKRGMERVVVVTKFDLLMKWFRESPGARMIVGLLFFALWGILFFRATRGTGISVFVVLSGLLILSFYASPGWQLLSLPLIAVLLGLYQWQRGRRRKTGYMPPIAQVEGGGIKRGLTAPEAAVLLELPLARVLGLVIFGLLKKGVLRQVRADPLTVEVDEAFRIPEGEWRDEPRRAAFYRQAGQKKNVVVHAYEHPFIFLIEANPGKPLNQLNFSLPMRRLIEQTCARMKGFDLSDTQDYYRAIVRRAMEQAKAVGDVRQREATVDRNFEWIFMDPDYPTVFDWPYRPPWVRGYGWPGPTVSTPSAPTAPSAPSAPSIPGQTTAGDVAASFAGWAETTMGGLASTIAPGSLSIPAPSGGFVDLSGVDRVTGEFFSALAEAASKGGGGGGGGGGGCACACAGCACACACAGGGR